MANAHRGLEGAVISGGEFRVLSLIAEGGMGKTYKGEHILTGAPVCIKHCTDKAPEVSRFLIEEACAAWDLRHYSIPAMRSLVKLADDTFALVMSYIPGDTLKKIVQNTGKLEAEGVAWITERILNVLMYMHFHGVVHGDLAPQNIIIQSESHMVVIVDFGLSLVKPTALTGSKGYTPLFASPEEEKQEPLLPQSDFFSLGKTMIYALTGGDLDSVKNNTIPFDVPGSLREFILRLLPDDVAARPDWQKEDLVETLRQVRLKCFGRLRSNMKPIGS